MAFHRWRCLPYTFLAGVHLGAVRVGVAVFDGELGDILKEERGTRTEGDPRCLHAVVENGAGHGHGVVSQVLSTGQFEVMTRTSPSRVKSVMGASPESPCLIRHLITKA